MKKILILSTSPLSYDGITMTILNYTKGLDEFKIDYAFSKISNRELKVELEKSHNVFDLSNNNTIKRNKHLRTYMRNLDKIMQSEGYDLIHVNGSSSIMSVELLIAKKNNCRVRISHSHNTKTNHPIINKIMMPIFKKSYTYAIACGKEAGEFLYGKNNSFEVIPNATDVEKFVFNSKEREEIRKKFKIGDDYKIIGHVGGFNKQKNQKYLINILKRLIEKKEKYYLMLIGSGYTKEEFIKLSEKEKIKNNVILIDYVKNEEIPKYYSAMDIAVLPSLYEGLPNVLIEWQISGLPCIVSSNVTQEANITGEIQYISLKDEEGWIETIKKHKKYDRKKISEKNSKEIKKAGYDINNQKIKMQEIYNKLLKESYK